MDLSKRIPELVYRLQFGDSQAATELSLVAESKPLILKMLKSRNPSVSRLAPIIASINKKTTSWLKGIAIHGGMSADGKLDTRGEKAINEYARNLVQKWMSNRKVAEEGIRKEVDGNIISKDELNRIIRSIPKEEIERIKKALSELKAEASNKNIAAYHYHEKEIKTSWLVNTTYGILTRNEVRAAMPSEKTENDIKKTIEKCIRTNTPVHIVGFWGGYKETESGRADNADKLSLDKVKETVEKLKAIGVKTTITILFADIHASNPLVGRYKTMGERKTFKYMDDIIALCEKNGFEITCLSRMWGAASAMYDRPESKKYNFRQHTSTDIEDGLAMAMAFMETDEAKQVVDAAVKYADVDVSTPQKAKRVATDYVAVRFYESMALNRTFPDSIFFAYSWPIEDLHPPRTLFWHSVGRLSNPPWYMEMKEDKK